MALPTGRREKGGVRVVDQNLKAKNEEGALVFTMYITRNGKRMGGAGLFYSIVWKVIEALTMASA